MLKKQPFLQFLRLDGEKLPNLHMGLLFSICACLFLSRYLLTISIISLFVVTVAGVFIGDKTKRPADGLMYASRWWWFSVAVFFLYLLSFSYSEDMNAAVASVKVKILFVILPFSLWHLRAISRRQLSMILHLFLVLCLYGACWSLVQIPLQKLDLQTAYQSGGVLPTIIHHIRFSLLAAFGAAMCFLLTFRKPVDRFLPPSAYLALGVFLAFYLHVLAVRSGLFGLYLSMLFLILLSFTNRNRLRLKFSALVLATAVFAVAYLTIPTLKSKVDYTLWSLKIYKSGDNDIAVYSDSRRLISYKAALHVIRENPMTGVGIGDVRTEIQAYYQEYYPRAAENYVQPHNQYLWTATAIGIPGALYLLFFNIALILRHIRVRNWLMVTFNLVWVASFLVEDTLEMQIGVAAYLFLNYLGWHLPQRKPKALA